MVPEVPNKFARLLQRLVVLPMAVGPFWAELSAGEADGGRDEAAVREAWAPGLCASLRIQPRSGRNMLSTRPKTKLVVCASLRVSTAACVAQAC